MRNVFKLLIIVLTVSLAAGCGGREDQAGDPRPGSPDAATTGESRPPEGTMAVKAARAQEEASGGALVETCDGGSIRLNAAEKRLLELHNEAREQRELEPLCLQPTLTEAARAYSENMIEEDYFAHTSLDGETLGERLKRFGYTPEGYRYWKVGGNIAWHSGPEPKPEEMFESWMNSPGHRANILDEDFRQIGIGTYAGQYESYEESVMYTADFGVRRR